MIKRILFLLCAIATLAALAGCGSGQSGGGGGADRQRLPECIGGEG